MPNLARDAESRRGVCGIGTRLDLQFGENRRNMMRNRTRRSVETVGDLSIGESFAQQRQNLDLSPRKVRGVGPRRPARTTWDAVCTERPQAPGDFAYSWLGA